MNYLRLFPLHILTLLVVLAGTTQLSAAPSDQNSSPIDPQIVGGEEAEPGAWPAMAAIVNANIEDGFDGYYCGGTVISPEWVLTAAHCFYDATNRLMQADEIDVILGQHLLSSNEGQRIDAIEIILHPDHRLETYENDIGLIRLREAWDGEVMLLAQTSIAHRVEADDLPVTVIGWGDRDSSMSSDFPDALHQVTIPIVNNSICLEAMSPNLVTTSMMCAGLVEGGKDACKGDSGGPLMVSSDRYWIQVGIVSWGKNCAQPNLYGVYTRVSDYFSWVENQTGETAELAPLPIPTAITLHKAAAFPVQSPSYLLHMTLTTALSMMMLKLTNREQYANKRTK